MKENFKLMTPAALLQEFLSNIDSSVSYVKGDNPFSIKVCGEEMYIYIKNLSPARLSNNNPDIWRIQLPVKKIFEPIILSKNLFILLGYDFNNKVYTTWNPYWCKQRLNVGKSVSMYSRLSLQKRVSVNGKIEQYNLNNNGKVICIPKSKISDYLQHIRKYFAINTKYVAIGSSIQKKLNMMNENERVFEIFKKQINTSNLLKFLLRKGLSEKTALRYVKYLRNLLNSDFYEKYKSIFLASNNFLDYEFAISNFLSVPEIAVLNANSHRYYSAALRHYHNYLVDTYHKDTQIENKVTLQDVEASNISDFKVNEFGKLLSLDNKIKAQLRKFFINEEYPDYDAMVNIVRTYYPQYILTKMSYADWVSLFESENWKETKINMGSLKKVSRQTLRVTRPDGSVIQHGFAADTYIQVIKECGPERVHNLGIEHAGVNIVSKQYDAKYHDYQRPIDDKFVIFVNSTTEKKYEDLCIINMTLNLNLIIQLVDKGNGAVSSTPRESNISSERQKIKVIFPDGRTIQYSKVLETLLEVINYAGPARVAKLNIIVCHKNLVLREPHEDYASACKKVDDGWFVNTDTNTITKYNHICYISNSLHLGLDVQLL